MCSIGLLFPIYRRSAYTVLLFFFDWLLSVKVPTALTLHVGQLWVGLGLNPALAERAGFRRNGARAHRVKRNSIS